MWPWERQVCSSRDCLQQQAGSQQGAAGFCSVGKVFVASQHVNEALWEQLPPASKRLELCGPQRRVALVCKLLL